MEASAGSLNRSKMIGWLITILIGVFLMMIPITEVFTMQIKLYLVITICGILMLAFELMEMLVVVLLIPVAYYALKLAPGAVVFAGWTQSTVWMFFGALLLGDILERYGLLKRIAYFCMTKFGGSLVGLSMGMLLAGIVLAYTAGGAGSVLFIVFAYGLCKSFGVKKGGITAAYIMYIAHVCGSTAGVYLTYDPMFNAGITLAQSVVPDAAFNVTFFDYALHNLPNVLLMFLMVFIPMKVFKVDKYLASKEQMQKLYQELGKMSIEEKKCVAMLAVMFALFLTQKITNFDVATCFLLTAIICFLPGIKLGDQEIVKKTNYTMLFVVGGTLSIGTVANSIGAGALLAQLLGQVMGSGANGQVMMTYILGYLGDFILTPMASVTILAAPVAQLAAQAGYYPLPVIYAAIMGAHQTMFPYENAMYAFLFSFGMMRMKDFVKLFTLRAVIGFVYIALVTIPYWHWLGLFDTLVKAPF